MAVTIDGLVTGIDTQNIIDGLLKIQKQQVDRFTLRKNEIQTKQAAFKGVETRLLTLRSDIGALSRSQSNPFTRQTVTVSDETAVAASATENAASGVYQFTVNSTARAHQVASQGFADADSQITQGTIELRAGSGDVKTITIDSNNNTLAGLAEAINSSGSGIAASVVKDASGGASPYRLLLSSTKTGVENEISLTNNLAADNGAAVQPVIDFGTPVQAASDAEITIGNGAGAISVSSSTNRITGAFNGITIDLLQATAGEEVSLTVAKDTEGAVEAVEAFVTSFNDLVQYIDDQSRYIAASNQSGPLQGNRNAQSIQQKLRSAVLNSVPGVNGSLNRLSSIGITVTDTGRLQFNSSKLTDALEGRTDNVSPLDVKRLFALDATTDSSGVNFVLGSSRTKASSTPYQVDISQAAEQASITAASALAETTVITSVNKELQIKLDGAEATVVLNEGTYTRQELADHLESVINNASDLPGRRVSVSLAVDSLKITSDSYGRTSDILITGGTALTDLGLSSGQSDVGQDVAGSFVVNGETESAIGRGRLLSGDPENENTADLQLNILLGPGDVVAGPEATVSVTRGLGATLDQILGEFLTPAEGLVATADEEFSAQIDGIQDTIDRQQAVFDREQEQLLKQFSALEAAISQLQSTSSFVASQLAGIG